MKKLPFWFREGDPNFVQMITVEMDMNMLALGRVGYTVIDMLSDIGGI